MFVWLLAVTQGLPTYAVDADSGSPDKAITNYPDGVQSMTVADEPQAVTERDAFTVTAVPRHKGLALASIRLTFVYSPDSAVQWPFDTSPISSGFGKRIAPCNGCSSNHKGLDMTPGAGTPIRAIADGVVKEVNRDRGGLGTHVYIDHEVDGQAVTSLYAHMEAGSVALVEGQAVTVGTVVGKVGNTGLSTGAHLHLEISVDGISLNPYEWLAARVG